MTIIFQDESGFNLLPSVVKTWAIKGQTPLLEEPLRRKNHSAIGAIILSPQRRRIRFDFHLQTESVKFADIKLWLCQLHRKLRKKAIIVWDNLSVHQSAKLYFEKFYPDWFEFYFLPPYSPELNPVEGVWNVMKNSKLANYVFDKTSELKSAAVKAAQEIDADKELLQGTFEHAKLKL